MSKNKVEAKSADNTAMTADQYKQRMAKNTKRLERSTRNLEEGLRVLEEINDNAAQTAAKLKQQGDQIKTMNQKVTGDMQSQLVQSSSLIQRLERSAFINKLLWPF